jgi:hypothetical protein
MKEIAPRLYVGDQNDALRECLELAHPSGQYNVIDGWSVVSACKEPFHRDALGYTGRGAPRDHPEYLMARRCDDRWLILNMVDTPDPAYVPEAIVEAAVLFIELARERGDKVLVHCNQGRSRSPSLAMAYLKRHAGFHQHSFEEAEAAMRELYPAYEPAAGIRGYLQERW